MGFDSNLVSNYLLAVKGEVRFKRNIVWYYFIILCEPLFIINKLLHGWLSCDISITAAFFSNFVIIFSVFVVFLVLQALSAANLDLVTFVCETVNPSQVFNQTPCPLQQPVLLSLIQQLSADLGANTEMKHK